MSRLPIPGGDDNAWGTILNDFLSVEHNGDGSLKTTGSLATKVDTSDGRLSDARMPLPHASSHATVGSDPLVASAIGAVSAIGGGKETSAAQTATTSSTTINLNSGNVQLLTLAASTTVTLSGATSGVACSLSLYIQQDATGSHTLIWPGNVKWPGGAAPTLSTAANKVDLVVLETLDGGTTWYGSLAGADFR